MKKNNPKSTAVRQGENKQAGELFLDRIEKYLRTAPSDDIRTLTTPDMASQFALMRLFQRLKCPNPDASQEGIARMMAELHYRLATRDGLKVQRIGSKVVENTAPPKKVRKRDSGESYVRLHPEDMKEVRAIRKGVALQGEMLDAATAEAVGFIVEIGKRIDLTPKEREVAEAMREHRTVSATSRALIIKHGRNKGYSQPNVSKIVDRIRKKIGKETGRIPESIFTTQEPERHKLPPDGTTRR